ncbi:putative Protein roadkill [Hypsibius exemplaris]|uniref:BTB domain-containing protein n=1 Tax=Hypsibius exemplaris TaxID=2072580 RepID=A0A1W0WFN2_HYPEX|nr:putative Protein roadkill [Hypsibius exemplaris]
MALNMVRCLEFDLQQTIESFSLTVADDAPATQTLPATIPSSELGFPTADGVWFLFVQTGLHGKKHLINGQPAVRFGFAWASSTRGSFTVDVVLRIPSAGWESSCSNVTAVRKCEKSLHCEMIPRTELLDPLRCFAPGDTLTFEAHIKIFEGARVATADERIVAKLLADHARLLSDRSGADFTLVSSDAREFPVHRSILMARSRVFAAMLASETVDRESGRCVVEDVDGRTVEALLRFVYHASVEGLAEVADTLLAAADKYELLDLKQACEELLLRQIQPDNAAKRLILAEMHQAGRLKAEIFAYLKGSNGRVKAFIAAGGLKEVNAYNEDLAGETALSWAPS